MSSYLFDSYRIVTQHNLKLIITYRQFPLVFVDRVLHLGKHYSLVPQHSVDFLLSMVGKKQPVIKV